MRKMVFLLLMLLLTACAATPSAPVSRPSSETAPTSEEPATPAVISSQIAILPGTPVETAMTVLQSEAEGPVLFIVGGIHGDEAAGWMAADRLREEAALCRGTLYILSPANRIGAQNDTRATGEWGDLNRQFPGDSQGTPAQQLAAAIVGEIENASPVLVLDLHEAILKVSGRDFLGNSFIYSSLDGIDLLMMDLLEATRNGEICSKAFDYFGPGPDGSINLTVTEQLTIPVITVETYRAEPLEQRIQNQLDILHYVLRHYGMEAAS